jgi:hypothetical protein
MTSAASNPRSAQNTVSLTFLLGDIIERRKRAHSTVSLAGYNLSFSRRSVGNFRRLGVDALQFVLTRLYGVTSGKIVFLHVNHLHCLPSIHTSVKSLTSMIKH